MSALEKVADNLWVHSVPHSFMGLHVGTRMTVVRLGAGSVLLYSPVPVTLDLKAAIDALGPVRHIVCPNLFHHMYAGDASRLWPDAKVYGPAGLARKRPDLVLAGTLSETLPAEWQADLQAINMEGSLMQETVFFHPASKTLITSDLVENFHHNDHTPTRLYLRLGGILGKVGWHPLLRLVYRNRKKSRASLERILALPFEKIIVAHGDIIRHNAHEELRQGMRWL